MCYAFGVRLLGIDYGTKKVGLALSNEDGTMAFPHAVFTNDAQMMEKIAALIQEKKVQKVIVGKSHNLEGAPNVVQKEIELFVDALEGALKVAVVYEQEQFSTQEALRIQGRTEHTDASAAALILDSYIRKQQ